MSSNGLAVVQPPQNQLAQREQAGFNEDQIVLLKQQVCPDLSDGELHLFMMICLRTGLDPFSRQIYAIKRKGKMTPQTGIDGHRAIADRQADYAGSDPPLFDDGLTQFQHIKQGKGPTGDWTAEPPVLAAVTVYKMVAGVRCPFTGEATWESYYPGDGSVGAMWRKYPHLMLSKCAEAQALRKGWAAHMHGIYTTEEMQQADARGTVDPPVTAAAPRSQPTDAATEEQNRRLAAERADVAKAQARNATPASATPANGDDPELPPCQILKHGQTPGEFMVTGGEHRGQSSSFPVLVLDLENMTGAKCKAVYYDLAKASALLTGPDGEDPAEYRGLIRCRLGTAKNANGPFTFIHDLQPVLEAEDDTEVPQ